MSGGGEDIRDDDRGLLWRHLVLDVLRAGTGGEGLHFWRDKSGHEVDYVLRHGREVDAIEYKMNPERFDPESLITFRSIYPDGFNYLVCPATGAAYDRRFGPLTLSIVTCQDLLTTFGRK